MKKLSPFLLSYTVTSRRKALKMTQAELAKRTGMNRSMLSKLESQEYMPSIPQLQALADVLSFEPTDMFVDTEKQNPLQAAFSMKLQKDDVVEEVFYTYNVPDEVITVDEKEVFVNRIKLSGRDGKGTKLRL